jgi:thioredoxin reductase (NADPH)
MLTNIEGVYAVGDLRSKKYRQITTAVADGTIAAISVTRELDN